MEKPAYSEKPTPILLIAVGHEHNEGQITVLVTEDRTDEEVRLLLAEAFRQLTDSMQ